MKTKRKILLCSSVAVDYFLFLARCVGDDKGEVRLVYTLDEVRYRELARGGRSARLWMRFQMYIVYPMRLILEMLGARRGTLVIVTSNTFFAPALASSVAWLRGVCVVHLLYDLFPDALEVAGSLKRGGLGACLLGRVARANLRWPSGIVFLGKRLRLHAEKRWGVARNGAVIDISTDTRLYPSTCPLLPAVPIQVHYGGQLGAMHDADSLAAAVCAVATDTRFAYRTRFSFAISGSRVSQFRKLSASSGISIGATVPSSSWRLMAATVHIGLVTLTSGGATVCLPSKTYAMMASGMAIIAICPAWSDLAALINDNDAGWVIDNSLEDEIGLLPTTLAKDGRTQKQRVAREFVAIFERLSAHPEELELKRHNAYDAAHGRFGVTSIEQRWAAFLSDIMVR